MWYGYKKNYYSNTKWKKLRKTQILNQPLCEYCLHDDKITAAAQVDHIIPWTHENDLLFEADDLMSTCQSCHIMITKEQYKMDFKQHIIDDDFIGAKEYKLTFIKRKINADGYY